MYTHETKQCGLNERKAQAVVMEAIEIFVPVPGYEGRYEVSDLGRVYSFLSGKFLQPDSSRHGKYQAVNLFDESSQQRLWLVHRLVLLAFVGPCPEGMECCHDDDDASNNRLDNLRWDTHPANYQDAVRNGRRDNLSFQSQTHCVNNHEYTEDNTRYLVNGWRNCRTCERARGKRKRERMKGRK